MTLVIRGGTVIDGSGTAPRPADVLIDGATITDVLQPGTAVGHDADELDATGKTVCPGFIDVHSHADNSPFVGFDDTSKLLQGVTTEVVGNCGFSLAPVPAGRREAFAEYLRRLFPPIDVSWTTAAELGAAVDDAGAVVNQCSLVGHGALRFAAVGMDETADADARRKMRTLLEDALEAGAFGMSSGLVYPPSSQGDADELRSLCAILDDRVYATHMRAEGTELLTSIEEAIGAVAGTPARLQVSHLKAMGQPNWGATEPALERLDRARQAGTPVAQDVYPYTATSTTLMSLLPPPFLRGSTADVIARLSAPSALEDLTATLNSGVPGWDNRAAYAGWDGVLVAQTASGRFQGSTLAQVADELKMAPEAALIELLVSERCEVTSVTFLMDEADIERVLAHPWTMIGSDGLPVGAAAQPHPRLFGTFPRVLARYLTAATGLSLPEAIRRMTSLPADWFGIPQRGLLAKGYVADIVVLDADNVADRATYTDPMQAPAGISEVLISGRVVARDGEHLGGRHASRLSPR